MTQKPTVDPKRSGIRATLVLHEEPDVCAIDDKYYGPYGGMIKCDYSNWPGGHHPSGNDFLICCPGCGEVGAPRDGAKWTVTGNVEDGTITFTPSIQKNCCGWHGYLKNGIFAI